MIFLQKWTLHTINQMIELESTRKSLHFDTHIGHIDLGIFCIFRKFWAYSVHIWGFLEHKTRAYFTFYGAYFAFPIYKWLICVQSYFIPNDSANSILLKSGVRYFTHKADHITDFNAKNRIFRGILGNFYRRLTVKLEISS